MKHPWWLADLRGTLSIALGLAVLYWPRLDVETLVLLGGTFALADGILISLIGTRIGSRSMGLAGFIGLLVGVWLLSRPALPEAAIIFAIGVWAAVRGLFDISTAIQHRGDLPGAWLLMSKGVLLLVFGVLVSTSFTMIAELFPQVRAVVLAWMIAVFALVEGALLLVLAERLRRTAPRATLHARAA
jgi:uncharacterized membrane protein HdeD (DUF308 family)